MLWVGIKPKSNIATVVLEALRLLKVTLNKFCKLLLSVQKYFFHSICTEIDVNDACRKKIQEKCILLLTVFDISKGDFSRFAWLSNKARS